MITIWMDNDGRVFKKEGISYFSSSTLKLSPPTLRRESWKEVLMAIFFDDDDNGEDHDDDEDGDEDYCDDDDRGW